jgi:hypothetical protein
MSIREALCATAVPIMLIVGVTLEVSEKDGAECVCDAESNSTGILGGGISIGRR